MIVPVVSITCPVCGTTYTHEGSGIPPKPVVWHFPVLEPAAWYAASVHDITGALNDGYRHTGLDLNLDRPPWGDVDRGQAVYAVCDGVVYRADFHERYRGCVIILGEHEGAPLYVRYWHLQEPELILGDRVEAGDLVGYIGAYANAGDHIHFDMALDPFEPHWWFTRHPAVRWIDPVPVLKAHLTPSEVDLMLGKGDD